MTSRDFVIWLKGFSTAAHSYNITPKQWDDIQAQLHSVEDNDSMWIEGPSETLIEAAKKYKNLIEPTPEPSKVF